MITNVEIKNYKSILNLNLELGQVTVLIGENGSGKTNIIEAIAFGAATTNNKLDNEFLTARGIRVTEPEFMRSAFSKKSINKEISLKFTTDKGKEAIYHLTNQNEPYSQWREILYVPIAENNNKERTRPIEKNALLRSLKSMFERRKADMDKNTFEQIKKGLGIIEDNYLGGETCKSYEDFIIYSPENSRLRNFQREGQIIPLGRKGEGLFKLLKSFYFSDNQANINDLKELLQLFGWFKDFKIPSSLFKGENIITIFDRYIFDNSMTIDQRNMSEGFLFSLFYFSLLISEKTSCFFALENIETALNPKLCTKITEILIALSKKNKKQLIITTHSPAILDGLNLKDDNQRLFVVQRNRDGHTVINRYYKPKPINGVEPVKLSETFLRGYIGGLPNNFSI